MTEIATLERTAETNRPLQEEYLIFPFEGGIQEIVLERSYEGIMRHQRPVYTSAEKPKQD